MVVKGFRVCPLFLFVLIPLMSHPLTLPTLHDRRSLRSLQRPIGYRNPSLLSRSRVPHSPWAMLSQCRRPPPSFTQTVRVRGYVQRRGGGDERKSAKPRGAKLTQIWPRAHALCQGPGRPLPSSCSAICLHPLLSTRYPV